MNHCFFFLFSLFFWLGFFVSLLLWWLMAAASDHSIAFYFFLLQFFLRDKVLFSSKITSMAIKIIAFRYIFDILRFRSTESATNTMTKVDNRKQIFFGCCKMIIVKKSTFSLLESIQHRRLVTNQLHQNNCNNWQFKNDDDVRAACTFFIFMPLTLHGLCHSFFALSGSFLIILFLVGAPYVHLISR